MRSITVSFSSINGHLRSGSKTVATLGPPGDARRRRSFCETRRPHKRWLRHEAVRRRKRFMADDACLKADEARVLVSAIVDSSRDAILVLDRELRVHSANKAFLDLSRLGRAEIEGR